LAIHLPPPQPGPRSTQLGEHPGVEGLDHPPDRGFAGHRRFEVDLGEQLGADVVGPLADPGQGAGAGGDRSDRDHQHHHEWVATPAAFAGIGYLGEELDKGGGTQHGRLDAHTRDRGRCHRTRSFVQMF